MACFTEIHPEQTKLIPISFERQILPGTFEFTLSHLIDGMDLSAFEAYYDNDEAGRPAYPPALLLKIIILAYSRGVTSSRKIEQLCRENVLFMALAADQRPHFTTIADFVSRSHEEIADLFQQVVLICDDLGMIGREMFAIDGCKMPSNASKEWSGKHADLRRKHQKIDRAVRHILRKHKDMDQRSLDETLVEREEEQVRKLRRASRKIRTFLESSETRIGRGGTEVSSNITDPDSAKMKTSKGVIQGYVGTSIVDAKHQVVVCAEAFGQGHEHDLLPPMLESLQMAQPDLLQTDTKILADSGYFNRCTLEHLEERQIDAYIADPGFRSRDPRFKDTARYKPTSAKKPNESFKASDFNVDIKLGRCSCPAGHTMVLKAKDVIIGEYRFMQFRAHEEDCRTCPMRKRCLRNGSQATPRQFNVKLGITQAKQDGPIERMKHKLDQVMGRFIYSQRLGIVEPVFGHMEEQIGIRRFSLRGKKKVDGQWKLLNLLHNLLKIHRFGEMAW